MARDYVQYIKCIFAVLALTRLFLLYDQRNWKATAREDSCCISVNPTSAIVF